MVDLDRDQADILALILRVRDAVAKEDFDTIADCWVHAPYVARWNASRIGGIFVRQGWQDISARIRQSLGDPRQPLPPPDSGEIADLNIRVSGDLGWVTFIRSYPEVPNHRAGPDPAHHVRIVERHDGRWKLAFVGFLDTGPGNRGVARIRVQADAKVLWVDGAAARRLEQDEDVSIRGGKLRLRDAGANQKLLAAIRWAASLDDGLVPGRGALPIVLEAGDGIPARIWWVVAESGGIFFTFGQETHEQSLDAASVAYGLSPAQRIVAGHVVAGLTLPQIAAAMAVRLPTVRTHLDRIFEKTGVRNQTALVRVLLSAAAPP